MKRENEASPLLAGPAIPPIDPAHQRECLEAYLKARETDSEPWNMTNEELAYRFSEYTGSDYKTVLGRLTVDVLLNVNVN